MLTCCQCTPPGRIQWAGLLVSSLIALLRQDCGVASATLACLGSACLGLMRLLAGCNVGAASPDGAPELAQLGKYMLFSFPQHRQLSLSAVDGWCNIAPYWLVIERCNLLRILCNIAPYVLVSASRAAESVRMGPDEPYLKAKVVSWSFLQATHPTFVYLIV